MCLVLLSSSSAFCCWEEITPVVTSSGTFSGNDGYIFWNCSADSINGLISIALTYPTTQGTTCQLYKAIDHEVTCSRKIGYEWPDATAPEAATFILSWSGYVDSDCTAIAETIGDYSRAEEQGFARAYGYDFDDYNDKWMVMSSKGAHCPADPILLFEVQRSNLETMEVELGMPSSVSGSMTWTYLYMNRYSTRVINGLEASDTVDVNSSVAIFNHVGSGDSYNKVVDATAIQNALVDLSFQCGDDEGYGIDGVAFNLSRTLTFTMDKY